MLDFQHVLKASLARVSAGPAFVLQQRQIVERKLSSTLGPNDSPLKWQAARQFLLNVWPVLERKHGYQTLYLHEVFDDVANSQLDKTFKVDASLWRESRCLLNEEGEQHALRTFWGQDYEKAIYIRLASYNGSRWAENEYGFITHMETFKSTRIITSRTDVNRGLEWSFRIETHYAKQFLKQHICGINLRDALKGKSRSHRFSEEEFSSMKWNPAKRLCIVQREDVIWLAIRPEEHAFITSLI